MSRNRIHSSLIPAGILALVALLGQTSSLWAQRFFAPVRNSRSVVEAFRNVVAAPSESTVRVLCDEQPAALGTVVSADGHIITKASELSGAISCKFKDGRTLPATIIGVEDSHDLAMLRVETTGLRPIEWRSSSTAEVGHWLAAPGPGRDAVAIGVVSVASRKPAWGRSPRTAPKANSGYLGVLLEPGEGGVPTIGRLTPKGPAEKAGLRVGDIVLAVSGRAVRTTERLISRIQTLRPGQVIHILVKRGEEEREIRATLERFPVDMLDRGARMNMMGSELSHRLGHFPAILQHDLLIKPTDCGGPIVDLDGKAVGINIARAGRTESYAIPAEEVQRLMGDFLAGKLRPVLNPEDRIAELYETVRKLKADLGRAELWLKKVAGEKSDTAKKAAEDAVRNFRKRLDKAEDDLAAARKEQARK